MSDETRAQEAYEKTLAINLRLVVERPNEPEHHGDLAAALASVGTVKRKKKEWGDAREHFVRSLKESAILLQTNRLNPNGQRYYLQALSDLVPVCLELDDANAITVWNTRWRQLMGRRTDAALQRSLCDRTSFAR